MQHTQKYVHSKLTHAIISIEGDHCNAKVQSTLSTLLHKKGTLQ